MQAGTYTIAFTLSTFFKPFDTEGKPLGDKITKTLTFHVVSPSLPPCRCPHPSPHGTRPRSFSAADKELASPRGRVEGVFECHET